MAEQTAFARHLRKSQTPAESRLWARLRDRRLAGWKFRRQVPFGRYVADFCCTDGRLVVEVDGASHTRPMADLHDIERSRTIELFGYQVIRFWNSEIAENLEGVCATILAELERFHARALSPAGVPPALADPPPCRYLPLSSPRKRGAIS